MNESVSFYGGPAPQRSIDKLLSVTERQTSSVLASSVEQAPQSRTPPGASAADMRTLQAPSAAAARALGLDREHPLALALDPKSLRRLYQIARRRGLHAAFKNSFWRDESPEKAEELFARAGHSDASDDDVAVLARAQSANRVRSYVFLLEAEHLAEKNNARPEVRGKLERAIEQVWESDQEEIANAFFERARPLVAEAEHGQAWQASRGIYFNWVVGAGYADGVFRALLDQFGPEHLMAGVKQIRDTLAADLRSETVCSDVERMRQQQMDLETNRMIYSVLFKSKDFLQAKWNQPASDKQVADFCREVLAYGAGAAHERKLAAICKLVADEASSNVEFRVKSFMKQLPLGIWSNLETRDTLFPSMFVKSRL